MLFSMRVANLELRTSLLRVFWPLGRKQEVISGTWVVIAPYFGLCTGRKWLVLSGMLGHVHCTKGGSGGG